MVVSARLPQLAALFGTALGLVLTLAMPAGLFSGDEGIKLVQAQALVNSGWRDFAVPYLGSDADPSGAHIPLRPPFVSEKDGSWYGIYSVEWVTVSAVFWKLGGLRGVFLLSWIGAAAALWLLARLATRTVGPVWAAAVVVATSLGTPLLLYGTTSYEHAWGTALILASLTLLGGDTVSTKSLLAAGGCLGLAACIRPELAAFSAGFAAYAFLRWGVVRASVLRLSVVGSSCAGVIGLHLLLNLLLFGSAHPNLEAADHPPTTYDMNFAMLASDDAPDLLLWSLAGATILGLLFAGSAALRALGRAAALIVIAIAAFGAWQAMAAVSPGMFTETRSLIGLFTATPLAVLGLLRGVGPRRADEDGREGGAIVAAALTFVGLVVAVRLPGFWGGLELGSRYLLPAAPILILGAAEYLRHQSKKGIGVAILLGAAVLLLLSVRATLINGQALHAIRDHSAQLTAAVEASGSDDIITDRFWVPQVLAPLYFEKRVYLHASESLFRGLLALDRTRVVRVHGRFGPGSYRGLAVTRVQVIRPREVVVFELAPIPL